MGKVFNQLMRLAIVTIMVIFSTIAHADERIMLSKGQTLYAPVYSHIYMGNRERPFLLTATLSIRNVDSKYAITLISVDYYDTHGKLLRKYLDNAVTLGPFGSTRYVVPQKDKAGGSGANFVVEWKSDRPVNLPIIESIMIGAELQQGVSFTSRAQVITTAN